MRLWHYKLLKYLPELQIRGLHREICALRGKGWGKKHRDVDYVFKYRIFKLYIYHTKVMNLCRKKYNINISDEWSYEDYRGKKIGFTNTTEIFPDTPQYKEHNNKYLELCLHNLKYALNSKGEQKNIDLFDKFPRIKDRGYYDKDGFWYEWQQSLKPVISSREIFMNNYKLEIPKDEFWNEWREEECLNKY